MKLFLIRSGLRLVRHPKLQLALISNKFWHHFGLILVHFRSIFGTFLVQNNTWSAPGTGLRSSFAFKYLYGSTLVSPPYFASFWLHSGTILVHVCFNFVSIVVTFWSFGTVFLLLHLYGSFLTPLASHFGTIFGQKNNKNSIKKCVHFGIKFWIHFSSVFN